MYNQNASLAYNVFFSISVFVLSILSILIALYFKHFSGDDPLAFWVIGTNIFTMMVYWLVGGIYTFMDLTNRPAFLRKYKIQPGTNEPVERARLLKVGHFTDN